MSVPFIIAAAILLGLLLFLFRQLRSLGKPEWGTTPRWKRAVRVVAWLIPILLFSLAIWAFFIEPNRLIVHQETVQIEKWPAELSGLRIALIGDVHTGAWFIDDRKLQRIVELTHQQQAELIGLLG